MFFEPELPFPVGCLVAKSLHSVGNEIYCNLVNTGSSDFVIESNSILGHIYDCEVPVTPGEVPRKPPEPQSDKINKNKPNYDQMFSDIDIIKIGKNLSCQQVAKLKALLIKHYEVFQWGDDVLGCTKLITHSIPTGSALPIIQKQYPIPSVAKEAMRKQVKIMLEQGVIEESNGSWRSPILLIKKIADDGIITYRFCIDLRKVNALTTKDAYSLPRIDETVDALSGAKFLSTMDIDRAFWQVLVKEEDKDKTGFMVDGQLYRFRKMPFGSMNAPATFQRLMDRVLRGLTWRQCLVYIDDVLVFAATFEEHLESLNEVLTRIKAAGLKLKPTKCAFGDNEVNYLGYKISDRGLQPSARKIDALTKVDLPRTTKILNSFLCSINYYRTLIPNYGNLTAELYEMTTETSKFCKWTEKTVGNFNLLKKCLCKAPILAFPDFKKAFVIQADASKLAIGGVCLQQHELWRPVQFFGRKLTKIERKWSTTERELLALVYGYKACFHLVFGRKIVFRTDHEPLVKLTQLKEPFGRLGRLLYHLS